MMNLHCFVTVTLFLCICISVNGQGEQKQSKPQIVLITGCSTGMYEYKLINI